MRAHLFPTQAAARGLLTAINARQGYPRNGQQVGGGVHATETQGTTNSYAEARKALSGSAWIVPADDVTRADGIDTTVTDSDYYARPAKP